MEVVYSKRYATVYSSDPAAQPGRMESIYDELIDSFRFVEPDAGTEDDLQLVHWKTHVDWVKKHGLIYDIALLAVGGAIKCAESAIEGEPAFGMIRPPGHHASKDQSWGFCYFNNVAVSIEKLLLQNRIEKALIVDIDLHYGDGTATIFAGRPEVSYVHPEGSNRADYLNNLSRCLSAAKGFDVVAVSAGFDRHEMDWGKMLTTDDYFTIGAMIKDFAQRACEGRRYAVLEGGYNLNVLGKNARAFLEGMK